MAGDDTDPTGLVAAGTPELFDEAAAYAALTGRKAVVANSVEAVMDLRPDVFVGTLDVLDSDVLDALYGCHRGDYAPGILTGTTKLDVLAHVEHTVAEWSYVDDAPRATEIYATIPIGAARTGDHFVVGGRATRAELLDALSTPSDVLTLLSHGDGVDAFIGGGLSVCAMPDISRRPDLPRTAYCMDTGQCFRHGVTVDEAIRSEMTISPTRIAARILVWAVCYGILSPRGAIEPGYGFLPPMLTARSIGTVVTTSGVALTSPALVARIVSSIYGGASLGAAVARFNQAPDAIAAGLRFYILGEPETRASPSLSGLDAVFSDLPDGSPPPMEADRRGVTFLRHYLRHAEANSTGEIASLARAAREAADFYDEATVDAYNAERGEAAPGPKLRALVVDFLALRGTVICQDWLDMAIGGKRERVGTCVGCESPTTSAQYAFHDAAISRRVLALCPTCGVVTDAPADFDLRISVSGTQLRLRGDLSVGPWTVVVRLGCQDDPASRILEWPSDSDGRPSEIFDYQGPWPGGSVRLAVIAIRGASLGILSITTRAPRV